MGKHKKAEEKDAESADRRRPEEWSAEEKLRAVIDAAGLSEPDFDGS